MTNFRIVFMIVGAAKLVMTSALSRDGVMPLALILGQDNRDQLKWSHSSLMSNLTKCLNKIVK